MKSTLRFALTLSIPLAFIGCSDDTGTGGSGGGTTGSTTSAQTTTTTTTATSSTTGTTTTGVGGGAAIDRSECETNADCPPDGQCIDINGGYKACQFPVAEATTCNAGGGIPDECCDSSECPGGQACYLDPVIPFCGGIQPQPYNVCAADQCTSTADCGNGEICVPAGVVGNKVAMCLVAACNGLACSATEACALVREPCCGGPAGFLCIDAETGCQTNAECPNGYCNFGACEPGGPICPA